MATATGNSTTEPNVSSNKKVEKPLTLEQRIKLHDKVRDGAKCDLESPASLLANVNIKQLLTPAAFDSLPTGYQHELVRLLPEADRLQINEGSCALAMTVTALSNEFFAKSCVEYRERLKNGEFSSTAASRTDIDHVTWECDGAILNKNLDETGVPKAGEAFISTPKAPPPQKPSKTVKYQKNKVKAQAPKPNPIPPAAVTVKSPLKAAAPAPVEQKVKERTIQTQPAQQAQVAGIKRPQSVLIRNQPSHKPTVSVETVQRSPTILRKVQKVVETNPAGVKVTKVVPVVVRNPNGQIVTTLADCNPLLTEMIKNPQNCQTPTAVPVKVKVPEKKHSLLPTILNKNSPVIVTLKQSNLSNSHGDNVNKAVAEVLSKIQSTQATNGTSQKPIIVTVNGGTNGSKQIITTTEDVNLARSRQICESSKQTQPTLNLERSYQICKQVLGKTGSPTIVSVMVGPGGKKSTLISKPVRNRLLHQTDSISNQNISDIALYKNKHRGKPAVSLSGHVFLAMKFDEEGYAAKAYKRKTAFKQKPKKKINKSATTKSKATAAVTDSVIVTQTSTLVSTPEQNSSSRQVTVTTDTKFASEPVLSVTEATTTPQPPVKPADNNSSLLSSCMCNQRALVICQKCGAFNHAECMSKDQCLACLDAEK